MEVKQKHAHDMVEGIKEERETNSLNIRPFLLHTGSIAEKLVTYLRIPYPRMILGENASEFRFPDLGYLRLLLMATGSGMPGG